ncbi:MAG: efflux RND transporter permease subunit [Planctomycetes bacterium]|nr:efflux RND transporter permease subunit [Planctomycetota bacterium]
MFNAIIAFSLRNRLLVVSVAAILCIYGALVILDLPVDVFPDLNRPTVTVFIEAEGLAPEEVEALVTLPIESQMNGAPGVERVRSVAGIGLGLVFIEFGWDTNIYIDRQLIAERLQQVTLPEGVTPVMGPISSIMGNIFLIGVSSEKHDPMEVRTLSDWVIRRQLLTIPGIAQATIMGGEVKQYQVMVDPARLKTYDLTLDDVEEAVKGTNRNSSGGFLIKSSQEALIRNTGRTVSVDDIANTVVALSDGVPILVKHVADVKLGGIPFKRGDGSVNAKPAVMLSIQKQPGADTLALTVKIDEALDSLEKSLPEGIRIHRHLFRQSNFIEAAIHNVEEALRDGFILVLIVLFLFLLNFRTSFITITAIPLSIIITALVFKLFGLSINTMTLGGLAVAIGELVDDAIVDVENVFRRLRENRHSPNPRPVVSVIFHASSEVRNSIVFATIIVVLVFVPLFALSGIEGRIFRPLGIAYIVSISASLLVSLTLTPALCYFLLGKAKLLEREEDGFLVRFLKRLDRWQLQRTLRHPNLVMMFTIGLVIAAISVIPLMGREFLPPFNEGSVTINILAAPGTSLEESNRLGALAEKLILKVPEVSSTGRRTGRAEQDDHAEGVHSTEIEVELKESERPREIILNDVRNQLGLIPGVVFNVGQPISHRIDHLLSGIQAQVAVKLFGTDLDVLRAKAEEIRQVMDSIAGVVDLQVEKQVLIPQVRIRPKRDEALKYGIRAGDLTELLETAFNGEIVSQILDGQRTFDLVVRFKEEARNDVESLRSALIDTPLGVKVPVSEVAEVIEDSGPNAIYHENAQRRIVIQCNTTGRDLNSIIHDMQQRIAAEVKLPEGYFITYGGQFQSEQAASRLLAFLSIFSIAGMFLVLYAHFRSVRLVLQIMLNIPFALIGSVLAVYLTGGVLSVATLIGFITLCGIASRNGIMMLSHYIHLMKHEGEGFTEEMVIRGSLERLVPVLMTASTAALGLIPLMLSAGQPGKEILYPVAFVIFGGLVSSTLLDMFVTPTVFFRFGRPVAEKIFSGEEEEKLEKIEEEPEAVFRPQLMENKR